MKLARLKNDVMVTTSQDEHHHGVGMLARGQTVTFKGANGANAILVNPHTGHDFETPLANVDIMEERRG